MSDALQLSIGTRWGQSADQSTITLQTVDATNDGVGFVFQTPTTEAITHLGVRYGVRAGTPPTFLAALEGIDASGFPNGTVLGGGTPASGTFTPPADTTWNSTWRWVALANAYTPNRGEKLAMTIRYSSGTIDGSNNSSFAYRTTSMSATTFGRPYALTLTAGTWTKQTTDAPLFGIRTANKRYGLVLQSLFTTTMGTTGNRSTMRFTLPAAWGDTYKVAGARLATTLPAAGGSFKFGLWDGTTEMQAVSIDTDELSANSGRRQVELFFTDVTLDTLTFGTEYRIGLEVEGSLAVGLLGLQLSEANDRLAFPLGTNRGYSSWNGSVWSDDDTVMPLVELILDDLTEPAGGGGGGPLVGPGRLVRN
jgi:hypothetical protein